MTIKELPADDNSCGWFNLNSRLVHPSHIGRARGHVAGKSVYISVPAARQALKYSGHGYLLLHHADQLRFSGNPAPRLPRCVNAFLAAIALLTPAQPKRSPPIGRLEPGVS
ncbi:hypothetical protein D9M70_419400 [compost metagenome]